MTLSRNTAVSTNLKELKPEEQIFHFGSHPNIWLEDF